MVEVFPRVAVVAVAVLGVAVKVAAAVKVTRVQALRWC
jgi:hypothetical protein